MSLVVGSKNQRGAESEHTMEYKVPACFKIGVIRGP